ncbi:MAG: IS200/IS605 family transposase [Bacteroidia bacterium]|nr:IS200/IS605 family transposase [Bacteroidia bacterium]
MSHSLARIWVHAVFSTKERLPLISEDVSSRIYNHIKGDLMERECYCKIINGMPDHIHILFILNPSLSLAKVIKDIKGESSHWINQNNILDPNFAWQKGYGAFSVSETNMTKVDSYIRNQKVHHEKITFEDELKKFQDSLGIMNE